MTDQPANLGVKCEHFTRVHERSGIVEHWQEFTGLPPAGGEVRQAYSLDIVVGEVATRVDTFQSSWGKEFTPASTPLTGKLRIENVKGRSSSALHPHILVHTRGGAVHSYAVAWSGNWVFELEPLADGYAIRGGLLDTDFARPLAPDQRWITPKVLVATSQRGSLNEIGNQYRLWCEDWIPRNALADRMPVEWNHWWCYEDKAINEETFGRNVDAAAEMGMEVCTLDAGWFGSDAQDEHWYDIRGDWHKVNRTRFPHGIRHLADHVHARGMKFGLWCEIEAVGAKADLRTTHSHFIAQRDGEFLGHVCLAGPPAQDWAYKTLAGLIEGYACDWIKIDFNLDPGLGCNCPGHGHGPHDGLVAHYEGLYAVLDRIRARFPDVLLESCSSGGLRIDLGLLRHMHLAFLSDPDWPEHQLQCFWAASLCLPPRQCLHWASSKTRKIGLDDAFPSLDFDQPPLPEGPFRFPLRVAMLHTMGLSHPLIAYSAQTRARLAEQIAFYKLHVRPRIRDASLYRLTPQALRTGQGAGWNAFEYVGPEGGACLFVFRLAHGQPSMCVHLKGLDQDRSYVVKDWDAEVSMDRLGADLMNDGLILTDLAPRESRFLTLE